ncbi:MAG: glutamate synthase large subunit, partial [Steroidobacteraceae bacterium]
VLRSKYFTGLPEMVINYFRFVAEDVRAILASLGVRSLAEIIGRTEYLEVLPGSTARQRKLDLAPILSTAGLERAAPQFCTTPANTPFDSGELAERMVREMLPAIEAKSGGEWHYQLSNFNRSIGARLSGEIARRWGNYGMQEAPITVHCSGNAGQSFGVWNAGGLQLYLEGDANDYVGKGMAAGRIVLRHPRQARYVARDTVIMGNTCLYGATGGELYAAGIAGERFAVRNSGALAVVEGAGDHCCEYMTGGAVCVLGRTGVNFGAGFTGGFAYVLDLERNFVDRYNHELIDISRIHPEAMQSHVQHLESLLAHHIEHTGSAWGEEIMADLRTFLPKFWVVKPKAASIDSLIENLRRAA